MRFTATFLGQLPPQQRSTLLLVYGEGFDYEDAARVLDSNADTIEARLIRASASLADRLSAGSRAPTEASAAIETLYRDRGHRTTTMTELSDELLVAYVDGQLAREQTRAVDKVLEQDEVVARRVEALKEAHGRLEAAFEAILAGEMVEMLVAPTCRHGPSASAATGFPGSASPSSASASRLRRLSAAMAGACPQSLQCDRTGCHDPERACEASNRRRTRTSAQASPPASSRRQDSAADRRGSRRCAPCCSICYRDLIVSLTDSSV